MWHLTFLMLCNNYCGNLGKSDNLISNTTTRFFAHRRDATGTAITKTGWTVQLVLWLWRAWLQEILVVVLGKRKEILIPSVFHHPVDVAAPSVGEQTKGWIKVSASPRFWYEVPFVANMLATNVLLWLLKAH
jgi:hypothetical protein